MAEYLTTDNRIIDSTGLQIGGIQEGNIDYNNPRMIIEYLTIDA